MCLDRGLFKRSDGVWNTNVIAVKSKARLRFTLFGIVTVATLLAMWNGEPSCGKWKIFRMQGQGPLSLYI
jgi:hypothetical protein